LEVHTNVLFAAAGVAAAGTIVLALFTNWTGSSRTVALRPVLDAHGGGGVLAGTF
jgi:hypothetical protein